MLKVLIVIISSMIATSAMSQTPEQFIEASREGLRLQTSAHSSTWHLGNEEQWSADLDAGVLVLQFANGVKVTAPVQVVGTYNENDGTFLWGWDHPSIPVALRKHATIAKQWGELNKAKDFINRKVSCTEDDAWSFAAVTNRLAKANGVYRGSSDTTLVFMTFGEVKVEKDKP